MKESDNTKTFGSIMIPKARGVPKYLFRVSTPKEMEYISISLQAVHYRFFSRSIAFAGSPWS